MLHMSAAWREQLAERASDLRGGERFWNQQDRPRLPGTEAVVGVLGCVADDHDRQVGVFWTPPYDVEQRLAHVEARAIEHKRIGALFSDELVDARVVGRRKHVVPAVA